MLGAVAVAACLWVLVYWVEAEKEVRVLCALSGPGTAAADVDRQFGTATLLQVVRDTTRGALSDTSSAGITLHASSTRNLSLTVCEVTLRNGAVVRSSHREQFTLAPLAGTVAMVAMGALLLFQLALAAGAPLGRLAWGGAQQQLDNTRRIASGVVALALLLGLASTAQLMGAISLPWLALVADVVVGVLTVVFTLSLFANLASSSRRERWTGAPLALVLACCGVVLLLAG